MNTDYPAFLFVSLHLCASAPLRLCVEKVIRRTWIEASTWQRFSSQIPDKEGKKTRLRIVAIQPSSRVGEKGFTFDATVYHTHQNM
jgi:hypothetical protein